MKLWPNAVDIHESKQKKWCPIWSWCLILNRWRVRGSLEPTFFMWLLTSLAMPLDSLTFLGEFLTTQLQLRLSSSVTRRYTSNWMRHNLPQLVILCGRKLLFDEIRLKLSPARYLFCQDPPISELFLGLLLNCYQTSRQYWCRRCVDQFRID